MKKKTTPGIDTPTYRAILACDFTIDKDSAKFERAQDVADRLGISISTVYRHHPYFLTQPHRNVSKKIACTTTITSKIIREIKKYDRKKHGTQRTYCDKLNISLSSFYKHKA